MVSAVSFERAHLIFSQLAGCGFLLARKGLFPPAASKGLAQVTMNIGLPCLLFSSMVPSFNSENISNFGPLCLVAIIIMAIGLTLSLIIREVFYVPANFQWVSALPALTVVRCRSKKG